MGIVDGVEDALEGGAGGEADPGRRQQRLGEGQAVAHAVDPDEGVEGGLRGCHAEAGQRADAPDDEVALCEENGIEFAEIQVANDALGAVVHPDNPLECISIEALKQMWDLDTPVDSWGDIEGLETEVPDEPLTLFGPGSDSGTFDYWTDVVNGDEGRIRTDYNSIGEDDAAAVNGVASDPWASAYIPFSYVQTAGGAVKALSIVNPDSGECVEPTLDNVLTGDYAPLGRPLFLYVSGGALERTEVLTLGMVLVVAGFAYKIAAAPFHMWCPDVYEGAPTPVTAFMAGATEGAGFPAPGHSGRGAGGGAGITVGGAGGAVGCPPPPDPQIEQFMPLSM